MPVICIGPVCVPTNLLLPFVIGILHRYGYLKWFRTEWVTFKYWRRQIRWLIWSIVKSRIVKWWRGDKTPDSLERPPRESGDDSEAQQAEQAAKDATQDPNAGISNTSARQTPSKQSSAASSSNASTLGQTAAGQSQRAGRSGPGSSGPDNIGSAPQNTQDQSSGGWLSWLTGGRSSSSQQPPGLSGSGAPGKKAR